MKLFDLHCDTPLEMFLKNEAFDKNGLSVSLEKADAYDTYIQCAAVWSDSRLTDAECFERYEQAVPYFKRELARCGVPLVTTGKQLRESPKRAAILTVEGARLVCGEIVNVQRLYNDGVRIMTLVWKGRDSVGGAWDTDEGLTPLGFAIVEKCLEVGIIPDISHGSDRLCREVLDIMRSAGVSPLATHSNSRFVRSHPRNLSDENFKAITKCGGLCGISLCPEHLTDKDSCTVYDAVRHIEHYISLCGSECVALGCDFDGISSTPKGLCDISKMTALYEACRERLGDECADRVFFENAYNYLINNLPDSARRKDTYQR